MWNHMRQRGEGQRTATRRNLGQRGIATPPTQTRPLQKSPSFPRRRAVHGADAIRRPACGREPEPLGERHRDPAIPDKPGVFTSPAFQFRKARFS